MPPAKPPAKRKIYKYLPGGPDARGVSGRFRCLCPQNPKCTVRCTRTAYTCSKIPTSVTIPRTSSQAFQANTMPHVGCFNKILFVDSFLVFSSCDKYTHRARERRLRWRASSAGRRLRIGASSLAPSSRFSHTFRDMPLPGAFPNRREGGRGYSTFACRSRQIVGHGSGMGGSGFCTEMICRRPFISSPATPLRSQPLQ